MDRIYSQRDISDIARLVLDTTTPNDYEATVIGLTGDLGAGKTTLTTQIAYLLGVNVMVVSPTFVIAKLYDTTDKRWHKLIHIDAYRIENIDELIPIGWKEMIHEPTNLIIIEWSERIKSALPQSMYQYVIEHQGDVRRISRGHSL